MSCLRYFLCCTITIALFASTVADDKLDYSRDIRPILADKCFACHGPDAKQRQAGLRLDQRDEALKRLESDAVAIVPGQPEASALVRRVVSKDDDERMPPPD